MSPADDLQTEERTDDEDDFRPVGTVTFLVLYAVVLMSLWGAMYLTMLSRGGTE
jgi:hypothetical protein